MQANVAKADVVIVTALSVEYEAVLRIDDGITAGGGWYQRKDSLTGLPEAFATFMGVNGAPLRFVVEQSGAMGGTNAAATLAVLCERYRPKCLAMSGVCAGRPGKTLLGDVIAGERLDFFDTGKVSYGDTIQSDPENYVLRKDWKVALEAIKPCKEFLKTSWFRSRPVPMEWQENWVMHQIVTGECEPAKDRNRSKYCPEWHTVLNVLLKGKFVKASKIGRLSLTRKGEGRIGEILATFSLDVPYEAILDPAGEIYPFRLHVAPIGTGNKVYENEAIWGFISERMRKTLGLEMEAAAVGRVANLCRHKPDALVMKGVMDFANHGRDDHFKEYAARASAECLIGFLRRHLVVEGEDGARPLVDGTQLEFLHRDAILEVFRELAEAWGVNEAALRIQSLIASLAALREPDAATLKAARKQLRPYFGNSVRNRFPKTVQYFDECRKALPTELRGWLTLFEDA